MTQHDLRTDLDRGEAGERWLDRLLAPRYAIESLTPESRWFDGDGPPVTDYRRWAQTHGIDRVLVCRETGARLSVEVKTDYAAHRTGNMFFELTAPGGVISRMTSVSLSRMRATASRKFSRSRLPWPVATSRT